MSQTPIVLNLVAICNASTVTSWRSESSNISLVVSDLFLEKLETMTERHTDIYIHTDIHTYGQTEPKP